MAKNDVVFKIINENVVRNLIRDGEVKVPVKKLDIPKDERWNAKQIGSMMLQGIQNGDSVQNIAKSILPEIMSKTDFTGKTEQEKKNLIRRNELSAIRNARTMTTAAENGGRLDSYKNLDAQGVVQKKVWMSTPDDRTRPTHIDIDGEEQDIDVPFSNKCMFPADGNGPAQEVWMCFTPETSVAVDSDILKSYRHWYDGDLIKIKTSNGVNLACTPNHPILSGRGWIKANALNDRDSLLVTFVNNNSIFVTRGNPNIKHVFSRMDTLHKTLYVVFGERIRNLTMNFHGDISTADVEVISQERLLGISRYSNIVKGLYKFLFKFTYTLFSCAGYFFERFFGRGLSMRGFMRGGCKPLPFFGGGLSHACKHSLRTIPNGDAVLFKAENDNGAANSEFFCKSFDRLFGMVFLDKVVSIQVDSFHGFVYNLQTDNNYYFVNNIIAEKGENSNGIYAIAHNCRCSMRDYIIGFKRADGSISYVEGDRGRTLHDEQMAEEKKLRNTKEKNNRKINNLTLEEKAEILSYKSFDYYEINEILRNDGINGLNELQKEKVRTLDSALYKLPNYEGDLTRSLYFYNEKDLNDFIAKCQKDNALKSKAYVSTSKNISEYYNSDAQVQIFIKDSKHGRDLEGYDNGENEVLYSRNSDFKIIKQGWKNDVYIIVAKERWHKWQV